jgi:hypothetical protein
MSHLSMNKLYGLAYQWALAKEPDLPHDEITTQVSIITDYLDFVWKHKMGKAIKGEEGTAPTRLRWVTAKSWSRTGLPREEYSRFDSTRQQIPTSRRRHAGQSR